MGVFSEIAMEQQNSMFDSSAAFEDDEAFELEEMESLPVPPVGTDTVPVSAASVSAGETASADAEEEPVDEVASDGEEKSAEEGNSAQPPAAEDEEKKRAEHEAAEAQRKAEFDAKQQAKKAAEQEQIARLEAMSDEEVIAASTQRVSTDVEKLTRRNMKECVSEHIQMLCMEDTAFARLTMHPKKNMIRCFQYINRKAWDYVQDELKASGTRPGPGQQTYGRAGYMQTEKHFAYLIQRCKDGFVVREFQADRTYGKESLPNSKLYCQEIRRTIYDRERKPRTYYWGLYKQRNMRWISGSPCSYSWSGSHDGRVYGKTLPTLEQQELRCTGLVNWIRKQKSVDPEKYLAVLERIPQMEQISKVNLPKLTKECFSSCGTVSELIKNHSAGSLIKALGLDSRRFQRLRLHNGGCDLLRWLQYEKGIGREIPDNVLLWMCQQDIEPGDVQFIADRMSMVQVYNYVRRQMPSFRRNSHEVLRTWEDYLSMAKKLHMNVYDEIVYRTRKLRRRHDDLVLKCQEKDIELQAEEMEEKFPHVNAICQEIKAKYEYADADYMVVVPDGILDIITEGRALHHCAGSSDRYWDRIERRESFVVFLRKTADPFHAYYTLEVEPDGTVRQKRTEYDRQKKDIEQATEFLQKWQRVITARLTESDKALAAESRILREKEFIQLKKDRVIIHTGHLAGRLLADVLMADLMENTDSIQSPVLAAAA